MTEISNILLTLLLSSEEGRTCRQLQKDLRTKEIQAHHGTISGALSHLHKRGDVFYLVTTRNGSHPYVHISYKSKYSNSQRVDKPRTTKWRKVADTMYEAMTNIDTTNKQWEEALASYEKALND